MAQIPIRGIAHENKESEPGEDEEDDDDGSKTDVVVLNEPAFSSGSAHLPRNPPFPISRPFPVSWYDEDSESVRDFSILKWAEVPEVATMNHVDPEELSWATTILCMRRQKGEFLRCLQMPHKESESDCESA